MKTIDELGISPTPWSADDWSEAEHGEYDVRIRDANDNEIAQPLSTYNDARLIAAAPDLYRSLREAVVESCVSYCGEHPIHCHKKDGECFVQKWRNALAKASGEEAE